LIPAFFPLLYHSLSLLLFSSLSLSFSLTLLCCLVFILRFQTIFQADTLNKNFNLYKLRKFVRSKIMQWKKATQINHLKGYDLKANEF
jgi:hypothetical protein